MTTAERMIVGGGLEALRSVLRGAEIGASQHEEGEFILMEEQKSICNMVALLFEKLGWEDAITFDGDGPCLREAADSNADDSV